MKFRVNRIHFIGIGGIGMSGIAEVLHNQGYRISGSDASNSSSLQRLSSLGVRTCIGHASENIAEAQVVVVSSAIRSDNVELLAARAMHVPVVQRAEMLAELMRMKRGIAIAGTHGKTTTTSLVASVLAEGGLDPTYVIGGRLHSAGTNARMGDGEFFVAEADESDASFLHLSPTLAVITNIDADHMETYGHSIDRLYDAFVAFANHLPFYGSLYACADDPGVVKVLSRITKPLVTYGFDEKADVRAVNVAADGATMRFEVIRRGFDSATVSLNLAGRHNVANALAAIAIGQDLGVAPKAISRALSTFAGVGRRFDRYGAIPISGGTFELIDDYGHHPRELATTLAAARAAFPARRLVLAFQPHRYTRTRDLFNEFVDVLATADSLLLTDVYAAGEPAVASASGRTLAAEIAKRTNTAPIFVERIEDLPRTILNAAQPDDVVMTMGAGSIGQVAVRVAQLSKSSIDREVTHE